jgi:16S rRNA (cytidine1402-2'-O)-methyltransferase
LLGSDPAANVATLYVVGVPAGEPDDFTLRALRVLGEVSCVVADDVAQAQCLLDNYELTSQLAGLGDVDALADLLESRDLALLAEAWLLSPSRPALALIRLAMERGHSVVPVPGPSLPITALVVSGLPADSFVYLGELPQQAQACHSLLSSVRGERRTLVLLETPGHLRDQLTRLLEFLGDRKLVVAAASGKGAQVIRRGTIRDALEHPPLVPSEGFLVLAIGGAEDQEIRWDEQRLLGEVHARLDQGLGAKEVSQQLAGESGWPRRDVYRLAVEASRFRQSK